LRAAAVDWDTVRAEDRALVARCLKGDEEAWVLLWTRYGPLVKALARRAGCSEDEARDVVQSVALAAVRQLHTIRDAAMLGGWLASTTRHQAARVLRQRRPQHALDRETRAATPEMDELLIHEERLAMLRVAFVRLDPRCQRMLDRLDLQEPGDSYQAVAAAEGLATSSIGPIRHRCLKRLRKLILDLSRSARRGNCSDGG
jgi:RNA polymerase sigma factor (sigma-70 family)